MKKISPTEIKKVIIAEAHKLKRKEEIYDEVKKLNEELGRLDEVGMLGSFGFKAPNDVSNITKTGFEAPMNISHIARLEAEMAATEKPITEDELNEVTKLKAENESLKKELEEIKKNIKIN